MTTRDTVKCLDFEVLKATIKGDKHAATVALFGKEQTAAELLKKEIAEIEIKIAILQAQAEHFKKLARDIRRTPAILD